MSAPIISRAGTRSASGRCLPCQNRLDEAGGDEAIQDLHSTRAARITTTPDRLAIDPVKIHVLQPGKEGLGVEVATAIDTEIDHPQLGADR